MKTIIITISISLIQLIAFANNPSLKDFETPYTDFADLNKIETYVNSNDNISFIELKKQNPDILNKVNLLENSETNTYFLNKDMPLVGGFWWGCCLSVIGLALVFIITDNDKQQVRKALIGCLIGTLIWGVGGIFNPFGW